MDAIEIAARRAGVEIEEGKKVDSLVTEGERITGVACGAEMHSAGCVIVAAGCWSSALLETAGLRVGVTPARGQMIAVRGEDLPVRSLIHSRKCYLVPRHDGRILIGATVEYLGFKKGVTAGGIRSLLDAAIEIVPDIDGLEIVETWSGLRPDTPDHLPVLGAAGPENLILATGHFRNGILLAPVTAQLIAEAVITRTMPDEMRPFSPERFIGQGLED
jgi:glycine/D-amino acid oxidase-like deaminating enzyme